MTGNLVRMLLSNTDHITEYICGFSLPEGGQKEEEKE